MDKCTKNMTQSAFVWHWGEEVREEEEGEQYPIRSKNEFPPAPNEMTLLTRDLKLQSCSKVLKSRTRTCSSVLLNNSVVLFGLVLLILSQMHPACSLLLDCSSVKDCICHKMDNGGWELQCPNDLRARYPIVFEVERFDAVKKEASLTVKCDDSDASEAIDPWSYFKGLDLSAPQIYSKIVRFQVNYCPPVKDGWDRFFKLANLTGTDITIFSFVTEDRSDLAKAVDIPSNFFDNMPNIKILILRENQLKTIPDLSGLKNLERVNLRSNDIEAIPPSTFVHNSRLHTIALVKNKISRISAGTFPTSLAHLELNHNRISELDSSVFANMTQLKQLYLNSNGLENLEVDTFNGLTSLEELRLDSSKMKQYPNFLNLPKLMNLTISNAIRTWPHQGAKGEITTTLPPPPNAESRLELKNLPSLENLNLPFNDFTSLPVFDNLPKLRMIILEGNKITEIPNGSFAGLPSLKIIQLRFNSLTAVGKIEAPSLLELDVSSNNLTVLENDTFLFLSSLKKLNLARNQIHTLKSKVFEPLADLEQFDISYNQVTFSSPPAYSAYALSDEYNFFGDVNNQSPLRSCLRLKVMKLQHNNISKLGFSDWSQVFTQLEYLDLSYNQIKSITANELNFISQNLTLNLEHNEISLMDMRMSILLDENASPTKIVRVFLNGNPLECTCLAYHLKKYHSDSYDLKIKNLTCAGPPSLQGLLLTEVPDDSLLCDMEPAKGCPEPCTCQERFADQTILANCSGKNLTSDEIPSLNTFQGMYSRWKVELDLSDNEITDFNNTSYIHMFLNKTMHINLSGNKLTSTLFLENIGDYQDTKFSISDNPFLCNNCVGFQFPWRAFSTRISDLKNVTCERRPSEDQDSPFDLILVKDIKNVDEFCTSKFGTLIFVLAVTVIFLFCLCIALFITIRFGWAIKAYLYSKGWDWCLFWEKNLEEEDDNEKLYDAFVSYSHKDEEWVVDELVSKLEGTDGFKLCLHFRDWTPGDWIPDQIVRSVNQSRRTIVILSKHFVESVWSRLEFKAAHAQALQERSNRVILILLGEDLRECDVQDEDLKMYMKMNTFMKWNDPLFWHRLKYALPHKKAVGSCEDRKQQVITKMQQRERAIQLDKLRAKLEQTV